MSAIPDVVAGLLQPVRDEMARLTREIDTAQAKLSELVAERRQLQRILTAADPSTKPGRKNGGPPKEAYHAQGVSEEMIERVFVYVQERYPPEKKFNGTEVLRDWKLEGGNPSEIAIRTSLTKLRERGRIRLAGRGKGGSILFGTIAQG